MALTPQVTNRKNCVALAIAVSFCYNIYCQNCEVYSAASKSFHLPDTGMVATIYKQMSEDNSTFRALVIVKSSFFKRVEFTFVRVDSSRFTTRVSWYNNSLLDSVNGMIPDSAMAILTHRNGLAPFYEAMCELSAYDETQFLIVSNPWLKQRVELTCFDGTIEDVLKQHKALDYLYGIYKILFLDPVRSP